MARKCPLLFLIFFIICMGELSKSLNVTEDERKIYIIYMGSLPKQNDYSPSEHHIRMLREEVDSSEPKRHLVTSYTRSFNGFAAYLTDDEQQKLAHHHDVVSVFPDEIFLPQTTNSWDFMHFPISSHRNPGAESQVIIGVIDSGIWPESTSFDDHGLGPIPRKWKGVCQGGPTFKCNKKIIGARVYSQSHTPRDFHGHGTHCASIAAGINIQDASFYGIGHGIARGGVPNARIAVYKPCNDKFSGCATRDILNAFDDAIADGVDIISISLAGKKPNEGRNDSLTIGSLHAIQRNILTVHSAGNNGFTPGWISSFAPWIFTVGASSTNRRIVTRVLLGNMQTYMGNSINGFSLNATTFPIVYGMNASGTCSEADARACKKGCLNNNLVKGKIVFCDSYAGLVEATAAGAQGCITLSNREIDTPHVVPSPISALFLPHFRLVQTYVKSSRSPVATIFKSDDLNDPNAPIVATFSSRGPNKVIPDILKPDIVAPGVSILAATSPEGSPSGYADVDKRRVPYSFNSGTSMACPHVAGAAAYVKTFHPTWSPSAIKSALMTTSIPMGPHSTKRGDGEFSYGAGHLNPSMAVNPGLIYETRLEDYIAMGCGLHYDPLALSKIFGEKVTCSSRLTSVRPRDLNYPTMTAYVKKNGRFEVHFPRSVTNVGLPNSIYMSTTSCIGACNVTVEPNILRFRALNEKISFVVTMNGEKLDNMISANLEWKDGTHHVRSPIVVY